MSTRMPRRACARVRARVYMRMPAHMSVHTDRWFHLPGRGAGGGSADLFLATFSAHADGPDRIGAQRRKRLGRDRVFTHVQIDHGHARARRRHAPVIKKTRSAGVAEAELLAGDIFDPSRSPVSACVQSVCIGTRAGMPTAGKQHAQHSDRPAKQKYIIKKIEPCVIPGSTATAHSNAACGVQHAATRSVLAPRRDDPFVATSRRRRTPRTRVDLKVPTRRVSPRPFRCRAPESI